ncbi:leucine--tRNA ligase [Glycocaulis profundi]|nr:leucine--tRNA ligase [Glycocaulis profundi]
MSEYDFTTIEARWRERWAKEKTFKTHDPKPGEKTFYVLDMFPYPSGSGLHVGHPVGYLSTDIVARYKRMAGFNVLHPMGWDSFGLPAEQHAIKTGEHPEVSTEKNIATFRRQMELLGLGYDWDREIATSKPDYYKWTQYIFARMYDAWFDTEQNRARHIDELEIPAEIEAQGKLAVQDYQDARRLVYFDDALVNWCEALGTILANEEVYDGKSEQGHDVVRVPVRQVKMRITAYAERLIEGLEKLDWPEGIKDSQRNWIGRSEGVEISFRVHDRAETIPAFTTRIDTLAGVTFMALAPEHPLVDALTADDRRAEVDAYREAAARKSDLDRTVDAQKTGVRIGRQAVNPLTGARVEIFVADYVLFDYGTGAVMGVPAHDERDFEFAKTYGLPVIPVNDPGEGEPSREAVLKGESCWTGDGAMLPPRMDDPVYEAGVPWQAAWETIADHLETTGAGRRVVSYNLRDWIFSRQRYWGEPIPIIHWEDGTRTTVPLEDLPVKLPHVADYKPLSYDKPALAKSEGWVEVADPKTGMKGRRELNTMPQWAGSCWYPLRYMDPRNDAALVDPDKEKAWGPVDLYVGGAEHATLHLLYARFWYKALHDLGLISTDEPFTKLVNQGMLTSHAFQNARGIILPVDEVEERGEGTFVHVPTGETVERIGAKMSKSLRNVVTPDDVVARFGSDAFRVHLMFMGPIEGGRVWDTDKTAAALKFLRRAWNFAIRNLEPVSAADEAGPVKIALGTLIEAATEDLDNLRLNTAIAELMKFLNAAENERVSKDTLEGFIRVLAPFAPHMAEELWERAGHQTSVFHSAWPKADAEMLKAAVETIDVVLQEGGKKRAALTVEPTIADADIRAMAMERLQGMGKDVASLNPERIIVVRDKKTGWVKLLNVPKLD